MNKGFTQILNRIICSGEKINDAEFRLYCTLLSHGFHKGSAYPSRQTLALEMGASIAKIDRVKKSLELKGAFRKKRRGQGITNLYFLNDAFLMEAEESPVIRQEDSSMIGKQEGSKKTLNNYLKKSSAFKEVNTVGGRSQSGVDTPKEVIFCAHLNRIKIRFDNILSKNTSTELYEKKVSTNTQKAINGVLYYIRKYKDYCGVDHPLYKKPQLEDCVCGFLYGLWIIEQENSPLDETLLKAIDRWFNSTNTDSNNLKLSHFAGNGSQVIFNCIQDVLSGRHKIGAIDCRDII